jgi:hypothetical protein
LDHRWEHEDIHNQIADLHRRFTANQGRADPDMQLQVTLLLAEHTKRRRVVNSSRPTQTSVRRCRRCLAATKETLGEYQNVG